MSKVELMEKLLSAEEFLLSEDFNLLDRLGLKEVLFEQDAPNDPNEVDKVVDHQEFLSKDLSMINKLKFKDVISSYKEHKG